MVRPCQSHSFDRVDKRFCVSNDSDTARKFMWIGDTCPVPLNPPVELRPGDTGVVVDCQVQLLSNCEIRRVPSVILQEVTQSGCLGFEFGKGRATGSYPTVTQRYSPAQCGRCSAAEPKRKRALARL